MTEFAYRLKSLGTETAFAVSQDAAEFAAQGNKVYPFHLGDLDLPTPPNIMEAAVKALRDGKIERVLGFINICRNCLIRFCLL